MADRAKPLLHPRARGVWPIQGVKVAQKLRRVVATLRRISKSAPRRVELADDVEPAFFGSPEPGERKVTVLFRLGLGERDRLAANQGIAGCGRVVPEEADLR